MFPSKQYINEADACFFCKDGAERVMCCGKNSGSFSKSELDTNWVCGGEKPIRNMSPRSVMASEKGTDSEKEFCNFLGFQGGKDNSYPFGRDCTIEECEMPISIAKEKCDEKISKIKKKIPTVSALKRAMKKPKTKTIAFTTCKTIAANALGKITKV